MAVTPEELIARVVSAPLTLTRRGELGARLVATRTQTFQDYVKHSKSNKLVTAAKLVLHDCRGLFRAFLGVQPLSSQNIYEWCVECVLRASVFPNEDDQA